MYDFFLEKLQVFHVLKSHTKIKQTFFFPFCFHQVTQGHGIAKPPVFPDKFIYPFIALHLFLCG